MPRWGKLLHERLVLVPSRYLLLMVVVLTVMLFYSFFDLEKPGTVSNYISIASKYEYNRTWADSRSWRIGAFENFTSDQSNASSTDDFHVPAHEQADYNNNSRKAPLNATFSKEHFPACVFPNVNPFEPSVVKVAGLDKKPVHCEGNYLPDLTYVENNTLLINSSKVEVYVNLTNFQHCRYRHIWRHETNDNTFKYSDWEQPFTEMTKLPANTEFIVVECTNKKSELVSKSYFSLIPKHEEFDEIDSLNFKKRQAETDPKETLNIIMIGLDSLSRYHFLRSFDKTYSYLMNTLKSFDLTMHSQLGKNTFPNFLPLFTGRSEQEVNKWWADSQHLDTFDMIWRTFEEAGYRTFYTEDWPLFGAFHYLKKGFVHKFSRYNNRPLAIAMDKDNDIWNHSTFCTGNQVQINSMFDYVTRFLETFPGRPVFGVAVHSKVTHEDLTQAKMFDQHIYNFYTSLNERGFLNNTLLITFSDHGPRWGPIRNSVNGVFESRTPYTILTFPEWFLLKYPGVAENLRVNTERLTTHFDTHATLLDLLYFQSNSPPPVAPLRHGISLFQEIPLNRTCKDVPIPNDFCVCGHEGIQEISLRSELSEKLAALVLRELNSKRDPILCAVLKIGHIKRIVKIILNKNESGGRAGKNMFKVTLQTTPGDAVYEANVHIENSTIWTVGREIDRLNLYRGQADCIENANDRPFCYCKNLLTR